MAAAGKPVRLEDRIKEALSIHDFLLWRGRLEDKVMPIIRAYIGEMVVREHEIAHHEDQDAHDGGDMDEHSSEFGLRGADGWVGNP